MLLKKNIFYKYKTVIQFVSFNKGSLNKSIWKIRMFLKILFFNLLKQTYFNKLICNYKLMNLLYNFSINLKNNTIYNITFFWQSYKFILLFFKSLTYKNYYLSNRLLYNFSVDRLIRDYNTSSLILTYNSFFIFYKKYTFFLYLWLYSIKVVYFCSFNVSHLPTKKKKFVVLRSPHKDKKSRELFEWRRLKKTLVIPSFVYDSFFFKSFYKDSLLLKFNIHTKQY